MILCTLKIRHIARSGVWDMGSRIARKNLKIEKKMFKTIAYMLGKCKGFLDYYFYHIGKLAYNKYK